MKRVTKKINVGLPVAVAFSAFTVLSTATAPIAMARSVSFHGGSHIGGMHSVSHSMHMAPHNFGGIGHTHFNNIHGGAEGRFRSGHEMSNFKHEDFGRHEFGNRSAFGGREERGFGGRVGEERFGHNEMARREEWLGQGNRNFDRRIGEDRFRHEEIIGHEGFRGEDHRRFGEHRHLGEHIRRHDELSYAGNGGGGNAGGMFGVPYTAGGDDDRRDEREMRR
jgi:hypothetical protein